MRWQLARRSKPSRAILRSYSRNISTLASKQSIVDDVNATAENLSMSTFDDYTQALQRLFVLQDIEAWCPAIRSKTAIRSGLKRGLADPSIAIAALGPALRHENLRLHLRVPLHPRPTARPDLHCLRQRDGAAHGTETTAQPIEDNCQNLQNCQSKCVVVNKIAPPIL